MSESMAYDCLICGEHKTSGDLFDYFLQVCGKEECAAVSLHDAASESRGRRRRRNMKRTVVDCDGCGQSDMKDFHTLSFVVGTQRDPPSGRTEQVEETLEFCAKCLGRIAQEAIKTRSIDEQKAMHQRWTEQKAADPHPRGRSGFAPAGVVYRDASG